jgi:putative protease
MKILSPAGSYKCAIAAMEAGADGVYLGLNDIRHQRSRCANFSNEELSDVVGKARKRNVQIHVTFNSSYNQENFDDIVDRMDFLESIGIEEIILFDIGLINVVHRKYPRIRINYSVQGQCSNSEFAKLLKNIGVAKIILDRNVSISEAKEIKEKSGVEVEMFAFGYQCYSQDSICYLGDYFMDEPCTVQCAQKIRFVGEKKHKKPKRYFFMKFESALNFIPQMVDSGIDYIKVEGRQRSSKYVYKVTKVFREAVDSYRKNRDNYRIDPSWVGTLRECAYDFELTDSFYEQNRFHRNVITDTTLKNKLLYMKDILSTFAETKNFTKIRKELFSAVQIELNRSSRSKRRVIGVLK